MGTLVTSDSNDSSSTIAVDASDKASVYSEPAFEDITMEKQLPANDEEAQQEKLTLTRTTSQLEYPPFSRMLVIMLSLYLTVFLVALDRTIIGTAVPEITNEFHSFSDIGWYGSAYMLTTCGFQLFYGKLYTYYSPKWIYITAIALFEIGSAVCGAAPSSTAFIIGRAIAGLGCAGITSGAMCIMINILPLEKRPLWMGLNGAMFGLASVVGPLLGGVFTTYVTWRWCFYINLPIGAIAIVVILLVLKVDRPMGQAGKSVREKILQLDPLGFACFLPGIVSLLLALQWGGAKYSWNDPKIVGLFVVFSVLILAFIVLQIVRNDDHVTVPKRVIMNRSIAAGVWYSVCMGGALIVAVYYIPIWFQAIEGVDAIESGIRSIPLVFSLVIAVILCGAAVGKIGYYAPFMIVSVVLASIGVGLLTTLKVNSGHAAWIGYQVLVGFGLGCGMQQSNMAAQTVLPRRDVSTGMALMFFGQSLGGSVFVAVAQNILENKLISNIGQLDIAGLDPSTIVSIGATEIRAVIPDAYLPQFLVAYNDAIMTALYVGVGLAAAAILGAATMEWKSVKKARTQRPAQEVVAKAEGTAAAVGGQ